MISRIKPSIHSLAMVYIASCTIENNAWSSQNESRCVCYHLVMNRSTYVHSQSPEMIRGQPYTLATDVYRYFARSSLKSVEVMQPKSFRVYGFHMLLHLIVTQSIVSFVLTILM